MTYPADSSQSTVTYPLLPLRDVVVFPHMVIPLFVGRPKSIKALETAMEAGKSILLVAQKSAAKDEPSPEDLYDIGSIANILQMLKLPDGTVKVLVEGVQRARVLSVVDEKTHYSAEALKAVALKALARRTGARGLRSILEHVLLDIMYDLPSLNNVEKVVVDEGMITGDARPILLYSDQPKVAGSA